jgi:hypothetical protein
VSTGTAGYELANPICPICTLLIAHERIRAYKMGGKTRIDLDSVDEYHASLPRVETRASEAADLRSETARVPSRRL